MKDKALTRKRKEIERRVLGLQSRPEEQSRPTPKKEKKGCLTFGFLMKWLAVLGLSAGTVYLLVLAVSAIILLLIVILLACVLLFDVSSFIW